MRQIVSVDPPVVYRHGPNSHKQAVIPVGRTERFELTDSVTYPGTSRSVQL